MLRIAMMRVRLGDTVPEDVTECERESSKSHESPSMIILGAAVLRRSPVGLMSPAAVLLVIALNAVMLNVSCRSIEGRTFVTSLPPDEDVLKAREERRSAALGNLVGRMCIYLVTGCATNEQGECVERR